MSTSLLALQAPPASQRLSYLTISLLLLLLALPTHAFINPNFTPIHLVQQSELILQLEVTPPNLKSLPARLVTPIKGQADKAPLLDVSKLDSPLLAELQKLFRPKQSNEVALLFAGKYEHLTAEGQEAASPAALHIGGKWFRLTPGSTPGSWNIDGRDEPRQGVWNGATDMLLRAVKYILTDPAPDVPVRADAAWATPQKIGVIAGKIHGLLGVDLKGDGTISAHFLAEKGDRLLRWSASKFSDTTDELALNAHSRFAAWGDFNQDGRLDLASSDGKSLQFWFQSETGKFEFKDKPWITDEPILSLAQAGKDGKSMVLLSGPNIPRLLSRQTNGAYTLIPIAAEPKTFPPNLGQALPCLVADFDGDFIPDILQPFAKGAIFYRGTSTGTWESGLAQSGLAGGDRLASAVTGDYDADGLLDLFLTGECGSFLWHNLGHGKFEETVELSGTVGYASKPGALQNATCDINNDGRQDLLILYTASLTPQIFFNRGFRSFGFADNLDIKTALPTAAEGQQAGLLADFSNNGLQFLLLALKNGEIWSIGRGESTPALAARVQVPASTPGPITVIASHELRSFGAWNIAAGSPDAFFGVPGPGPLTLKWQFPGTKPMTKEITLEKPMRVLLSGSKLEVLK